MSHSLHILLYKKWLNAIFRAICFAKSAKQAHGKSKSFGFAKCDKAAFLGRVEIIFTKVIKIDKDNIDMEKISEAAEVIKNGGTVCFPTETVYGLGANALSEAATQKIFLAKGRPSDNPLIVHINDIKELSLLSIDIPKRAILLSQRFSPGPLTFIIKKSEAIPNSVTAGLLTVAIRIVENPIARALIKEAGVPIAAPSANLSGSPSPTRFKHVYDDMFGRVDVIIDGGNSEIGVESTVIDISGEKNVLLRPGGVTLSQLREVLGEVSVDKHLLEIQNETARTVPAVLEGYRPMSPGMKYKHYSPLAEVIVVSGSEQNVVNYINCECQKHLDKNEKVAVIAFEENLSLYCCQDIFSFGQRTNLKEAAAKIFSIFRNADEIGAKVIYAEDVPSDGIGFAVSNRLYKAAGNNIVRV